MKTPKMNTMDVIFSYFIPFRVVTYQADGWLSVLSRTVATSQTPVGSCSGCWVSERDHPDWLFSSMEMTKVMKRTKAHLFQIFILLWKLKYTNIFAPIRSRRTLESTIQFSTFIVSNISLMTCPALSFTVYYLVQYSFLCLYPFFGSLSLKPLLLWHLTVHAWGDLRLAPSLHCT